MPELGKEADVNCRNVMFVRRQRGRNPAKSYINVFVAKPRQKCET
jgi:hypothetical protein